DYFEGIARDAGVTRAEFTVHRVPPIRAIAPLAARAIVAAKNREGFEELALELAVALLRRSDGGARASLPPSTRDRARIAEVLHLLESNFAEDHTLARLAGS